MLGFNNLEQKASKEVIAFMTMILSSIMTFAGNSNELKGITPDKIKDVYSQFDTYVKSHQNDTMTIHINDNQTISMYPSGKGYEVSIVDNVDNTLTADQGATRKVSRETSTYVFTDADRDGEAESVKKKSNTSTSTISTNVKAPTNLKTSLTKTSITPVFSAAVGVIGQQLKK